MNKQNIIRVTLLVSILVFTPAFAESLRIATNIQTNLNNTLLENIASALHKRGLEEKTAKERAQALVKDNPELFTLMLDNFLLEYSDITKEDIVKHLSNAALYRQNIELNSYAHLIDMYSKIKRTTPDMEVRKKLNALAERNTLMLG